jgi:predicted dehydrogenase
LKNVSILLVGIGGYGENYVNAFMNVGESRKEEKIEIAGVVDPFPERCSYLGLLVERKIPIYSSLEAFYKEKGADLAVISTPIHLHAEHIIFCLSKGSNVLCEKPLCAVYQDALKLLEAEKAYGKFVGIGYQLSYSNAVQEMKKDILSGIFGKAIQLKAMLLLPRGEEYYARNSWAGRIKTDSGSIVLDSPVNNACAHQLHNMLYVLGKTRETSENLVSVTAELYRANSLIENYDTAALRCITEDNVEILFYATHAVKGKKIGPLSTYQFEKGVILHVTGNDENFSAHFNDGTVKNYGMIPKSDRMQKFWDAIEAVRGDKKPACGIAASIPQLLCVNGAQESMEDIGVIPEYMLETEGEAGNRRTSICGIEDIFLQCYSQTKLPDELGLVWTKPGKKICLKNYSGYYVKA